MMYSTEYERPRVIVFDIHVCRALCQSNESFDDGDEGSWIDDE